MARPALPSLHLDSGAALAYIGGDHRTATSTGKAALLMPRFFRLQVDPEQLTDAMHAFVTDPHPSRNEREIIHELNDIHPESVDVLESMLLDGTEERQDVAAYVEAAFVAPIR
jgi:hypothetical protein